MRPRQDGVSSHQVGRRRRRRGLAVAAAAVCFFCCWPVAAAAGGGAMCWRRAGDGEWVHGISLSQTIAVARRRLVTQFAQLDPAALGALSVTCTCQSCRRGILI